MQKQPQPAMATTEHESLNDALIECVKVCGGSKVVGAALWPARGVEVAQRYLLSCLNADRAEKLAPEEVLHIMRLARERGSHVGMQYVAASMGYSMPTPVEPKDEAGELQRQFIEATRHLTKMAERIEKLNSQPAPGLRAAA